MTNSHNFFNPFHIHQEQRVIDFLVIVKKKPTDLDLLVQVLQIKGWENIEWIELDSSSLSVSIQIEKLLETYQTVLCLMQTETIDQVESLLPLLKVTKLWMKHEHLGSFQINTLDLATLWDRQLSSYLNMNPSSDHRHFYFFDQVICCLDDLEKAVMQDQAKDQAQTQDQNAIQCYYEYLEKFCNLFAFIQEYQQSFLNNQDFNTSQLICHSAFSMILERFEPLWPFLSHKITEWQLVEHYLKQLMQPIHFSTTEEIAKHYYQSIHYLLLQRHIVRAKALIDQMCEQVEMYFDQIQQQNAITDLMMLMQQHISAMEDMKEFKGANELYVYGLHKIFSYLERDIEDLYRLADLMDDDEKEKCNQVEEREMMRNLKFKRVFQQIRQYYHHQGGMN